MSPRLSFWQEGRRYLHFGPNMLFFMQPIMSLSDGTVFAHELLYRAQDRLPWSEVDRRIMDRLCEAQITDHEEHVLFVNLSHQSMLTIPVSDFREAVRRNRIYFELSEAYVEEKVFECIAARINELCTHGVQVAVDDVGSKLDGLLRMSFLDRVGAAKIDGALLAAAQKRKHAADTLHALVRHWNSTGVLTIAECVETQEHLALARELEFALVQGFYIDQILNNGR